MTMVGHGQHLLRAIVLFNEIGILGDDQSVDAFLTATAKDPSEIQGGMLGKIGRGQNEFLHFIFSLSTFIIYMGWIR
jgi:hypothetical protein